MDDPAAGGHPLHIAGADHTLVAEAVRVFDFTGHHVGDSFDAAVRMPRKTGDVIVRVVGAKIVEEKERVKAGDFGKSEDPLETNSGAFDGRLTVKEHCNGTRTIQQPSPSGMRTRRGTIFFLARRADPGFWVLDDVDLVHQPPIFIVDRSNIKYPTSKIQYQIAPAG